MCLKLTILIIKKKLKTPFLLCNSFTEQNACLLRLRKEMRASLYNSVLRSGANAWDSILEKAQFSWISFMLKLDVNIKLKCSLLKKSNNKCICNYDKFHKFVSIKTGLNYFITSLIYHFFWSYSKLYG